jgi:hypothetical protein
MKQLFFSLVMLTSVMTINAQTTLGGVEFKDQSNRHEIKIKIKNTNSTEVWVYLNFSYDDIFIPLQLKPNEVQFVSAPAPQITDKLVDISVSTPILISPDNWGWERWYGILMLK